MHSRKIWLITGVSSGLGKATAESVIAGGDFVIGTFRNHGQAEAFSAAHKQAARGLVMDITRPKDISGAFDTIVADYGRLDVLVNNAGYGLAGAIEETSTDEARNLFEANFFGTLAVTQAALPVFRKQRSGHIIQISSHGGVKAFAGFGIYNASKFALEGASEALAAELAPLGIRVTLVEPGPFRTGFAGAAFRVAASSIDDYAATAGAFRERMRAVDGKQEGDPAKAARAIRDLVANPTTALRLPLGNIALATIGAKLSSLQADLAASREVAGSVVF